MSALSVKRSLIWSAAILRSEWPTWVGSFIISLVISTAVRSSPTASSKFRLKGWIFNFGRVFQTHFVTEWSYYVRWRDNVSVAEVFYKSAVDEFLCCLRASPQPKVNSAKSICHGLHGWKIKNFFLFKVHSGFTPMAAFFFPRAFLSSQADWQLSKKERSPLEFVALWRGYFGFHWNGTESPEMSPIRKVWVLISKKSKTRANPIWTHPALIRSF